MYYPTQTDIRALYANEKILYTKLVLLNEQFQTVYEMTQECISSDISTNVDSDVRHTLNMTLAVKNQRTGIAEDRLLWIDKFVKIYVGVKIPYLPDILWYDKGIFVMTDYSYDAQTLTLRINCSDLICMLNGTVNGSLEGLKTKILEADKITIREAIIDTLTGMTPFTKYNIVDMPKLIPYDLEFSTTDTVWTILTKLRDLYAGYEMFFDTDGTFVCKQIATLDNDPVALDNNLIEKLYTNETDNGTLSSVRNVVKVWGKCLETDYYTDVCTYDSASNTYTASFTGIAINDDGSIPTSTKFAVKMSAVNTKDAPKIIIKNRKDESSSYTTVATYNITDSLEANVKSSFFLKDRTFVFRYRRNTMYVLGQWQICAVSILRNTQPSAEQIQRDKEKHGCDDIIYMIIPDSPFSVEKIDERMLVCSGTDYDTIQAIDDCITRAEYELWKNAKVVYTITLNMVYIPWLQGNEKIRFKMASTDEIKDWVVSSISSSYPHGVMTLNLTEFSPLYNFDVGNE